MLVLADPIIDAIVAELSSVVDKLARTKGNPGIADADRIYVIQQLSELGRDAALHLGPKEYATTDQQEAVAACFERAAATILSLWDNELPRDVCIAFDEICFRAMRYR